MAHIVAFIGAKGGTLKSACTLSLATELGRRGLRVAIVDNDPQGTTTRALPYVGPDGEVARDEDGRELPCEDVPNPLDAPPVEVALEHVRGAGGRVLLYRGGALLWKATPEMIANHIQRARAGVDVVLVDTVPVLGEITLTSAAVAERVVVPTSPTADDLDALARVVTAVRTAVDPRKPIRVVLTKAFLNRVNTREALALLEERYTLYPTIIPHRTTGEQANGYLRPAVLYDAIVGDGSLAAAYRALADDLCRDLGIGAAAGVAA